MVGLVHLRAMVDDPGREQNRTRLDHVVTGAGAETANHPFQPVDTGAADLHAELGRLLAHEVEQRRARYAAWITSVVARSRDERRAALAGIDDLDAEMEPGEIDRGGEAGWPCADHEAIEHPPSPATDPSMDRVRHPITVTTWLDAAVARRAEWR